MYAAVRLTANKQWCVRDLLIAPFVLMNACNKTGSRVSIRPSHSIVDVMSSPEGASLKGAGVFSYRPKPPR
jgi:hypothetical protein